MEARCRGWDEDGAAALTDANVCQPHSLTPLHPCLRSHPALDIPIHTCPPPSPLPLHSSPPPPTGPPSDALFILLVEKDAAFMRLAEDRFYKDYPCIILTAKGQVGAGGARGGGRALGDGMLHRYGGRFQAPSAAHPTSTQHVKTAYTSLYNPCHVRCAPHTGGPFYPLSNCYSS
jgi:hypothetical protein